MTDIDKRKLQNQFSRSLKTYRQAALVQKQMATSLLAGLNEVVPRKHFACILELGCGDGLLTGQIEEQLSYRQLFLVDIVAKCADFHSNRQNASFVSGDMEAINLPEADLILAGAALQWAVDLPGLIKRLYAIAKDEGILAFSSFGPNNLPEIAALTGRSRYYPSLTELVALLQKNHFSVLLGQEEQRVLAFPTPLAVLRHLRETGVNGIKTAKTWTGKDLLDFSHRYCQHFSLQDGCVSLSYHPLWIVARKCRQGP